jgi:hypothetical protein
MEAVDGPLCGRFGVEQFAGRLRGRIDGYREAMADGVSNQDIVQRAASQVFAQHLQVFGGVFELP